MLRNKINLSNILHIYRQIVEKNDLKNSQFTFPILYDKKLFLIDYSDILERISIIDESGENIFYQRYDTFFSNLVYPKVKNDTANIKELFIKTFENLEKPISAFIFYNEKQKKITFVNVSKKNATEFYLTQKNDFLVHSKQIEIDSKTILSIYNNEFRVYSLQQLNLINKLENADWFEKMNDNIVFIKKLDHNEIAIYDISENKIYHFNQFCENGNLTIDKVKNICIDGNNYYMIANDINENYYLLKVVKDPLANQFYISKSLLLNYYLRKTTNPKINEIAKIVKLFTIGNHMYFLVSNELLLNDNLENFNTNKLILNVFYSEHNNSLFYFVEENGNEGKIYNVYKYNTNTKETRKIFSTKENEINYCRIIGENVLLIVFKNGKNTIIDMDLNKIFHNLYYKKILSNKNIVISNIISEKNLLIIKIGSNFYNVDLTNIDKKQIDIKGFFVESHKFVSENYIFLIFRIPEEYEMITKGLMEFIRNTWNSQDILITKTNNALSIFRNEEEIILGSDKYYLFKTKINYITKNIIGIQTERNCVPISIYKYSIVKPNITYGTNKNIGKKYK